MGSMSKKSRGEKEVARLRREVEFLKTQVKAGLPSLQSRSETGQPEVGQFNLPIDGKKTVEKIIAPKINSNYQFKAITVDYSYLKKDLLKTALLAAAAFASIFVLYFHQIGKLL